MSDGDKDGFNTLISTNQAIDDRKMKADGKGGSRVCVAIAGLQDLLQSRRLPPDLGIKIERAVEYTCGAKSGSQDGSK